MSKSDSSGANYFFSCLTIYYIETDDIDADWKDVTSRAGTAAMVMLADLYPTGRALFATTICHLKLQNRPSSAQPYCRHTQQVDK
jgi:hypothetical protein